MESQALYVIPALAIAAVAVYTDTRSGIIPNRITFPAMVLGLGLHAILGGWTGLGTAAVGCAAGIAVFFIPFWIGNMGAGDVKLMGALGAFVGAQAIAYTALYAALLGGVIAVVILIRTHGWSGFVGTMLTGVRGLLSPDMRTTKMTSFPYATSIFAGLFGALVFGRVVGA